MRDGRVASLARPPGHLEQDPPPHTILDTALTAETETRSIDPTRNRKRDQGSYLIIIRL